MKTTFTYLAWVLILIGVLLGQSCGTYYYVGTKQTVLEYKEKGDVNLELGTTGDDIAIKHIGFGYAFTKHLAFNSSYSNYDWNHEKDYIWDNEIIYFHELDKNIFAAINIGGTFGKLNSGGEYFNLDLFREYVQPSIGFSNDYVDLGVSLRFTNLHYNLNQIKPLDYASKNTFEEEFELYDIGGSSMRFIEPAVTIGVGNKWVKLRLQVTKTSQKTPGRMSYYSQARGYLSINAHFNVSDVFGNKKKDINPFP